MRRFQLSVYFLAMADSALKSELDFYIANQADLVAKYLGRCIVIKGGQVLGNYATELEAVRETEKTQEAGTFLVQRVEPGSGSFTRSFHSRVTFA